MRAFLFAFLSFLLLSFSPVGNADSNPDCNNYPLGEIQTVIGSLYTRDQPYGSWTYERICGQLTINSMRRIEGTSRCAIGGGYSFTERSTGAGVLEYLRGEYNVDTNAIYVEIVDNDDDYWVAISGTDDPGYLFWEIEDMVIVGTKPGGGDIPLQSRGNGWVVASELTCQL